MKKDIDFLAMTLMIIGAINSGMIGVFHIDLIHLILETNPQLLTLFYIAIGVAGIYFLIQLCKQNEEGYISKESNSKQKKKS